MRTTRSLDTATFHNRSRSWQHNGPILVHLAPVAPKSIVPRYATFENGALHIEQGSVRYAKGTLQLFSNGTRFYAGIAYVATVRDEFGNLLFVNRKYH